MTALKHVIVIAGIVCIAFVLYGCQALKMEKQYSSTAALIRHDATAAALTKDELPPTYAPIPMNAVFNIILSRRVLQTAINEANALWTPEELWQMIEVRETAKGSKYFTITVTSPDKDMSAKLANTLAKVFLDEYKALINTGVIAARERTLSNIAILKNELQISDAGADQIEQKKAEIQRQEEFAGALKIFLDGKYLDITIVEQGVPATFATRKLFWSR